MRDLIFECVAATAAKAGLGREFVLKRPASDNLTLPRPRLELNFEKESHVRTGRKLAVLRGNGELTRKRELYEINLELSAALFASDESWVMNFCRDFTMFLPKGLNDTRGNWVKARLAGTNFEFSPAKRVGDREIRVLPKAGATMSLLFIWRISSEERVALIGEAAIREPEWTAGKLS